MALKNHKIVLADALFKLEMSTLPRFVIDGSFADVILW